MDEQQARGASDEQPCDQAADTDERRLAEDESLELPERHALGAQVAYSRRRWSISPKKVAITAALISSV